VAGILSKSIDIAAVRGRFSSLQGFTLGKSVRIGFLHYNTREEVDRLLEAPAGVRRR